jgi:hypothetical protein
MRGFDTEKVADTVTCWEMFASPQTSAGGRFLVMWTGCLCNVEILIPGVIRIRRWGPWEEIRS